MSQTAAEWREETTRQLEEIMVKVKEINGTVKDHETRITQTEDYIRRLEDHFNDLKKWGRKLIYVALLLIGGISPAMTNAIAKILETQ